MVIASSGFGRERLPHPTKAGVDEKGKAGATATAAEGAASPISKW
jgi:hypothetical protein